MNESKLSDEQSLQDVIDLSYQAANSHIRVTFTEDNRLTANQVLEALPGIFELHLAVSTLDGTPIVAPIDAVWFRAKIWIGIPASSVRTRLVRKNPQVSGSYTNDSFALIVHGTLIEVQKSDPLYDEYALFVRERYISLYGPRWADWYESHREEIETGFFGWIEPRRVFAKA